MDEVSKRRRGPKAQDKQPLCRVSILLPPSLVESLDSAAKEQGGIVNRSDVIRTACAKHLREMARA